MAGTLVPRWGEISSWLSPKDLTRLDERSRGVLKFMFPEQGGKGMCADDLIFQEIIKYWAAGMEDYILGG